MQLSPLEAQDSVQLSSFVVKRQLLSGVHLPPKSARHVSENRAVEGVHVGCSAGSAGSTGSAGGGGLGDYLLVPTRLRENGKTERMHLQA